MEISKALIEAYLRHTAVLIERGTFDCRDIRTANALRLAKKEIKKIGRRIENESKQFMDKG